MSMLPSASRADSGMGPLVHAVWDGVGSMTWLPQPANSSTPAIGALPARAHFRRPVRRKARANTTRACAGETVNVNPASHQAAINGGPLERRMRTPEFIEGFALTLASAQPECRHPKRNLPGQR